MSYHHLKSILSLTPETERSRERKKGRAIVRKTTKYSDLSTIANIHLYQPPDRRCGETSEPEGRVPNINTAPHLSWHPKGIHGKEQFWLEERRKSVRRYYKLPGHGEPHTLRGSMTVLQECVEPRAGKNRVHISLYDNKIVSIHTPAFQIYTTCRLCTYGNYFSWRSLTISESNIKLLTPGTHMHPTAI